MVDADDLLRGRLIEALMCDFRIDRAEILAGYEVTPDALQVMFADVARTFGSMVQLDATGLSIPVEGRPLTRMIARSFDAYDQSRAQHAAAI